MISNQAAGGSKQWAENAAQNLSQDEINVVSIISVIPKAEFWEEMSISDWILRPKPGPVSPLPSAVCDGFTFASVDRVTLLFY